MSNRRRLRIIAITSLGVLLGAAIAPPISQPQGYHYFADTRSFFDIPNFLNVISNFAFLYVGIAGIMFLIYSRESLAGSPFIESRERWPYLVLFLSVALTGIGSAYYHLAPDNGRLMWDRLPLAIAMMALLSAQLTERVSPGMGLGIMPALVGLGAASVLYWHWSEEQGTGNLNFYIVVQFYSLLVIVLLAIFFGSRYTRASDIFIALAWYAVAKLAEVADREIYDMGHLISGHTAKHVLAAVGVYYILHMLKIRRPIP
jgi:Ceramidase